MRLAHYLTEGRTQSISLEQTAKLLKTKCTQAVAGYQQGHYMCRGFMGGPEFGFIQPSKFTRKSAYVGSNYYTLIMSNHKSWWQYPRRDQSIVCTVGLPKSNYGDPYVVFPVDNSKIGVCNSFDLWFSFKGTFDHTLDIVSDNIRTALEGLAGTASADVDWETLQKSLSYAADNFVSNPAWDDAQKEVNLNQYKEQLRGEMRGYIPYIDKMRFDDWVYSQFDPKKNKFKLTRPGEFTANDEKVRKECWTDGDSVLIGLTKYFKLQIVDDIIDSIT
jgi:hypothetical protein